jgi:hypothetical protein
MSDTPGTPDDDDVRAHLMRGFDVAPSRPGVDADEDDELDPSPPTVHVPIDAPAAGLTDAAAGDRWLFSIGLPSPAPAALPWWAELPGASLDDPAGPRPDPATAEPATRLADLGGQGDAGHPVPEDPGRRPPR